MWLVLAPLVAPVAWVVDWACFLRAAGLVQAMLQEMLVWARGLPRPAPWGCWRTAQGRALAAAPLQRHPAAAATAPGESCHLLLLGLAALWRYPWGSLHGSSHSILRPGCACQRTCEGIAWPAIGTTMTMRTIESSAF